MTTKICGGPRTTSLNVDAEGFAEYKVVFLVQADLLDGPTNVLNTPGLPLPGSPWEFGDDANFFATRKIQSTVKPVGAEGPVNLWSVEFIYSTKGDTKSCKDQQITDPLLQPPKVSGSFVKYVEEATHDRFGKPILNSAMEQFRGHQVEFDHNRPQIKIELNVPTFDLVVLAYQMIDTVNSTPLWGFLPRMIKLSAAPWEPKFYGSCEVYYTVTLEFDVRPETFDRELVDESSKVLNGRWDASVAVGSGCTVDLTVSLGSITAATITNGGSGYKVSATIFLYVVQAAAGGTGGVLQGTTDAGGVVTAVSVLAGGSGYVAGTAGARVGSSTGLGGWVLLNIGGQAPNPQNPTHFIKFPDRVGNPMRGILNGKGLPAETQTGSGGRYISIGDGNLAHNPTDSHWWVSLLNTSLVPQAYDPETPAYFYGELIYLPDDPAGVFVAFDDEIAGSEDPTDPASGWLSLGDVSITDMGIYTDDHTYGKADVVTDLSISGPGKIRVEFYGESDFLLLGVPITL